MITYIPNPWETTTKAELVSIGTHKLYISTSGKPRARGSPVVIFFTGGGVPVAFHVRLQALVSKYARVYFYDRSGYDLSELDPASHQTAAVAALELTALLRAVHVTPPYVLVAHSYGGIPAREFLHLHSATDNVIAGMVLVDTATEMMQEVFSPIPGPDFVAVTAGVDIFELTNLREESKLSDEEWDAAMLATERTERGSKAEDTRTSGRTLATRRQFENQALGQRPLCVIRCNSANDFRIMYEAGVKAGNGTEIQHVVAKKFIETWDLFNDEIEAAQLRMSSRNRYVYVPDCGHDIPVRKPEIIAEEIKWVLRAVDT